MIGGRQVPASKVAVLQMIRELETRVDVLTARAKHGGVTIGDKTFQSESFRRSGTITTLRAMDWRRAWIS